MPYFRRIGRAFKNGRGVRTMFRGAATVGSAYQFAKKSMPRTRVNQRAKLKRRRGSKFGRSRRRKSSSRETFLTAAEYSRKTVSVGRPPRKNLRGAWKVLGQNISSNVYAFSNISPFGGANGALYLPNTSATPSSGATACPMVLYEVTTAPQPGATTPNIRWVPTLSNPTATGTLSWSADSVLTVVNSDNGTANATYPMGNDTLEYIKAKLMFYCPSTIPSRIQVDLIQITDTRLVPEVGATTAFATAFWQAQMKRFMYSPLEVGDYKYQKYIKKLFSDTFIMHPKETTEAVAATMRELNVFKRLNRKCTYNWEDNDPMAMLSNDPQINTGAALKTSVHPRARIYLMIRGQSVNAVSPNSASHPSYDIRLDMKHSQLSS